METLAAGACELTTAQIAEALEATQNVIHTLERVVLSRRLCRVAGDGDAAAVRATLGLGVAVDSRDMHGATPLMAAAAAGRLECVTLLLGSNADPGARHSNHRGQTPLMLAAAGRHCDVAAALLDGNAPVDTASRAGVTALYVAAGVGDVEMLDLLLSAGADASPARGHLPLSAAVRLGHTAAVRRLLAQSADPAAVQHRQETPPLGVAAFRGHASVVRLLLEAGAPVDARTLALGASGGAAVVRALLSTGIDVNVREHVSGLTAAAYAARAGKLGSVRALVA
ncbi:ankyrin repeat domain-containing protein, partial [Nereida ignava]|uniref:ankyrin repeat domain-containing protein n=1 Tax=Nereida ignava TaxID=282199 RepID=UPI0030F6010A